MRIQHALCGRNQQQGARGSTVARRQHLGRIELCHRLTDAEYEALRAGTVNVFDLAAKYRVTAETVLRARGRREVLAAALVNTRDAGAKTKPVTRRKFVLLPTEAFKLDEGLTTVRAIADEHGVTYITTYNAYQLHKKRALKRQRLHEHMERARSEMRKTAHE